MAREGRLEVAGDPKVDSRDREGRIARMARARHRVLARRHLLALGLSPQQIKTRLAMERLTVVHRGVYAVGAGALTREGDWMAAALFAGDDAFLSHHAALCLSELRTWRGGIIDVTAPRGIRPPRGIRAHRSQLPRDERGAYRRIPVTSTGRSILDFAATASVREVERCLTEAFMLGLPIKPTLPVLLDRYPGRRGIKTLRTALERFSGGPTPTKSDLEELFLDFLDRHGFPRPLTNLSVATDIGILTVDCAWPEQRVVIEVDAPSTHGSRPAMLNDRRRDRALRRAGWDPNRVMEEDLEGEAALAAEMTALFGLTAGHTRSV